MTIVGSREAAQAMPEPFVPVDHAITTIVDEIESADFFWTKDDKAENLLPDWDYD